MFTEIKNLSEKYEEVSGFSGGWAVMLSCFMESTTTACWPYAGVPSIPMAVTLPYQPSRQSHVVNMVAQIGATATEIGGGLWIATVPFKTLFSRVLKDALRERLLSKFEKLAGPVGLLP